MKGLGGKGFQEKGKGTSKGKDDGSGSIKTNAERYPVFTGDWYQCGEKDHSGKNCTLRGGPDSFDSACNKRGKRGHRAVACPLTAAELSYGEVAQSVLRSPRTQSRSAVSSCAHWASFLQVCRICSQRWRKLMKRSPSTPNGFPSAPAPAPTW